MNFAELFRHETDLQVLPAGQALFREGDQGDLMYVLMSGNAGIFVNNRLVEQAGPGTVLGEMALIGEHTRSAAVIADNDCKLLPIDQKRFNFLIQQTPNFALHMMKVIAERLRCTDKLLGNQQAG